GRMTNVLSADASVANYDDGQYETFAVAAGRSSLDLERVEVLRGPQGTLSGRNAIAGALNEITRHPNADEFEGEVRATYGNYDHLTLEGRISGPITDQYSASLYMVWDRQAQGYIKNTIPGRPDEGNVLNDLYVDAQFQAKWNSHIEMWTKFQSSKWFGGAGNAGAASGGWTPADSPTYEWGVSATGLNPGYGCTRSGATGATANTTVIPGSMVSPVADPCSNPAVDSPWERQRLVPYNVRLPKYYANVTHLTYHTDADFDIKYIFGTTYYDYHLYGPTSPGAGAGVDQFAPINSYKVADFSGLTSGSTISGQESFEYREENSFYSNEINFISTGDSPLQWVVGAYQFQQHYYQPVYTTDPNQPQWNQPNWFAGAVCAQTGGVCAPATQFRRFDNRPANMATSYAGFGQIDWQINDQFKVAIGARYSWDRKYGTESVRLLCYGVPACYGIPGLAGLNTIPLEVQGGYSFISAPPASPFPAIDLTEVGTVVDSGASGLPTGVVGPTVYTPDGFARRAYNANWSAVTGNAGVDWTPDENTLLYAKYGRGYKSGGFNIGIFTVLSFAPWTDKETVDSFEIGGKKTWNDWLVTNVAAFHYKYNNLQIPISIVQSSGGLAQSTTAFYNVPESVSQGIELETTVSPIDNLAILFNYSYLDAHVTKGSVSDPADPTASAPGAQPLYTDAQCAASYGVPVPVTLASPNPNALCTRDIYTSGTAPGGVGWNKAQNLRGNQLPNSAKNKIAVNLMYTWETDGYGTFQPSVSYIWRDKQYGTLFTRSYNEAPSWDQVDARLRWKSEDDTYEVIAFGKNIFDTIGYDAGAYGTRMAGSIVAPAGTCGSANMDLSGALPVCNFVQGVNGPTGYGPIRGAAGGIAKTYSVTPPATYGIELHYKFN
ncbi:MAG TPA: TonB-dependent receptor, partial [Rhizomicrobium sp.]|nr:TonB-dependent receptor [Rhizomicrobium sp.]